MDPDSRVRDVAQVEQWPDSPKIRAIGAGSSVVLLSPRKLRGTIAIVRRRMTGGWEVEIRSAEGTPMHLTLPEKALHLR